MTLLCENQADVQGRSKSIHLQFKIAKESCWKKHVDNDYSGSTEQNGNFFTKHQERAVLATMLQVDVHAAPIGLQAKFLGVTSMCVHELMACLFAQCLCLCSHLQKYCEDSRSC
jgi:hypothetical protein